MVGLDGNSVVLQVQLLNSGSSNARFLMVFGGLKRMGLDQCETTESTNVYPYSTTKKTVT